MRCSGVGRSRSPATKYIMVLRAPVLPKGGERRGFFLFFGGVILLAQAFSAWSGVWGWFVPTYGDGLAAAPWGVGMVLGGLCKSW